MPKHRLPRRFDRAIFDAHLIPEMESGTRLSFRFLQREEEELNRAVEDEFRANYQEEYQRACAQAEEKWYPYRDAGIIDDQQEYQYRSGEIDSILKNRWSELRDQMRTRYDTLMRCYPR